MNRRNSSRQNYQCAPESVERIILNVGGIKYETYRSTLTAYPSTLLGTMFQERNRALLHPTNENEYFIDRDGKLFRYILQFYRRNKIIWPEPGSDYVSREELEEEFDYFQIPASQFSNDNENELSTQLTKASPITKLVSKKLDDFILVLQHSIIEVCATLSETNLQKFSTILTLTFSHENLISNGITSVILKPKNDHLAKMIMKSLLPFGKLGYFLLDQYGEEIGKHLHKNIPEVTWELNHKIYGPREKFYDIILNINYQFNRDVVLNNSSLNFKEEL
ncbi:BTB/POZ protein [Rhizophagus clarus]|uniref:BTB/POZ protein n=1 Tax=Rhizophagus clarus TaxID=94130 RepID=A0A8H3M1G6_9GLOM|nr:BTB/POZ protein [Rhizophagus clarus]